MAPTATRAAKATNPFVTETTIVWSKHRELLRRKSELQRALAAKRLEVMENS
jgi:hypothetical protein